jgi:plastocyanin
VDEMNFPLGVIIIVGVLAAIILGFIAADPDDIIKPRAISVVDKVTVCTMEYVPVCGVDSETYGNLCMLNASDVKLDYQGECVIAEPEPEAETLPMALTVSIPAGVGAPGCEETNECYFPFSLEVSVGDTVIWNNDDIAAHTVTSGNFPEHDGLFDSSVFLSGDTFEYTFSDAGTFDYYCFVHPWMAGIVNVS